MKQYKAVGFVKQHGKNTWDTFNDSAIFSCPDTENPYEFFLKDYPSMFTHWIVEFQEVKERS